ncbi:hypothetical protein K438DRAFT_1774153 [Mycena galopus ATCC 62051]|nr:hypothetical protein K438DRAFT_1774153 [Mycena galopus ATCC 62051]
MVMEIRESFYRGRPRNRIRYVGAILGFWRESFEQEILKCSGYLMGEWTEKRQQGAHTTESGGLVKEIDRMGRTEEQQLKGSVWHWFVIGSAVSGITSGMPKDVSPTNAAINSQKYFTGNYGLLGRAWRDGQEETGSGANEDTRKELCEEEDQREASALLHSGVERSVQANGGRRINAASISPEEEKDDSVPFAREFQVEEIGRQKRSDDWRTTSHVHDL